MSVVTPWPWCCQVSGEGTDPSICFDRRACLQGVASCSSGYVRDYDILGSCSTSTVYIPLKKHKVNIKNTLKWDDWTLSQTSATGPKCRELQALSNVHQKPV